MVVDDNTSNSDLNDFGARRPNPKGLVLALELMELGIAITRQRLARENPELSHGELIAKTNEWLSAPRGGTRENDSL
jgi:hypothetical protein